MSDAFIQSSVAPDYFVSLDATQYHEQITYQNQYAQQWVVSTEPPDPYTGQGCMQATGTANKGTYEGFNAQLRFIVSFVQTGTYYFWVRGRVLDANDDSVFVGLDNVGLYTLYMTSANWGRQAWMGGANFPLAITSTGYHYIDVWMREPNFVLDKIVLTADQNYLPEPPKLGITIDYVSSNDAFFYPVNNAFDDDSSTFWYTAGNEDYPHEVQMDLERRYRVFGFGYQTRQDTSWEGTLGSFKIYRGGGG